MDLPAKQQTISAAASTFFGNVELTEAALLHLDQQEIMKVQRVSKFIQAVVQGSSKLQRKMFAMQSSSPEPGNENEKNSINTITFSSIPDDSYKRQAFWFRLPSDPNHVYATAHIEGHTYKAQDTVKNLTPAPSSGYLSFYRYTLDHSPIPISTAKVLPNAYLETFPCSYALTITAHFRLTEDPGIKFVGPFNLASGSTLGDVVHLAEMYCADPETRARINAEV